MNVHRIVRAVAFAVLLAAPTAPVPLAAQDTNLFFRVAEIERRLRSDEFDFEDRQGSRFAGDRTQRVTLVYAPDSARIRVKWAKAAVGGEVYNNVPRYEVAAYELQKLFLDEPEYVVPPTVLRVFPLAWYHTLDPSAAPTFARAGSVLVALQYWLWNVTSRDVLDLARFDRDVRYARHMANANVLTHLIDHKDANTGNLLISSDSANPRIFVVDNGVAFRSQPSDRGMYWRQLRVPRVPRATVDRLRAISAADLERALGVLAHYEIRDGQLTAAEPTGNLSPRRGVRQSGSQVQLGLTSGEIGDVHRRIQRLIQRVDAGTVQTF
jgi:hypothetical protein